MGQHPAGRGTVLMKKTLAKLAIVVKNIGRVYFMMDTISFVEKSTTKREHEAIKLRLYEHFSTINPRDIVFDVSNLHYIITGQKDK
jgi:hypothetical protein